MKWPNTYTIVRHAESAYNELKAKKEADPLFQEFLKAYENRKQDQRRARKLARQLMAEGTVRLDVGDHETPITELGKTQAQGVGAALGEIIGLPDIIYVTPYLRGSQTLDNMVIGWPELGEAPVVQEERLREQEHGLATVYYDRRVFEILNPDQAELMRREGRYWYRWPQGENVPDVRERKRSHTNTLVREHAEQNVLVIAHHLSKLSIRANFERFGAEEFLRLDREEKPINCGATIYRGDPILGRDGKLILDIYNKKLY